MVGGGHAGVEAAWAAAGVLGAPRSVALVTMNPGVIGAMSCNPAIGGLAKGQLVREIDAMGGLMGLAADASSINSKVLSESKGPAVHGPRAQCDKFAYARAVQGLLNARPEICIIAGGVESIRVEQGRVYAVEVRASGTSTLRQLSCQSVVLTTGTFMRGLMHTGDDRTPGGRHGEAPAGPIASALVSLGFELGRLKTGTPPRLRRASIRWDDLEPQWGDDPARPFSELSGRRDAALAASSAAPSLDRFPVLAQADCRQTRTCAAAHEVIRANLHRAPMFTGQIESIGPRYCPSIEDKVVRFADRTEHGVFLEPESHESDWIYCNGISTSLPRDVQDVIVRSMPGCSDAEIVRYGYAVEYDMVRPHQIFATGETRRLPGLFLAGQINGTSGYEEAAAQGLVAGLNAARHARGLDGVTIGRDEAYIGVLMDDLVTKTPLETYRMFTSRAEHRLLLRADNAPDRLTARAGALGLLGCTGLGEARRRALSERTGEIDALNRLVDAARVDGEPLAKVIRRTEFSLGHFRQALPGASASRGAWLTVYAARRYEPLLRKQQADIRRNAASEHRPLPSDADYARWDSLRAEARAALDKFRPATFGQAGRLEGITPADLTLLSVLVERHRRSGAAG